MFGDSSDPVCVRSRTGFIVTVAGCLVTWRSSLQSETATGTMQAEVIALAACCRVLVPIIDVVKEIGNAVGLATSERTEMHFSIHKDNAGCIALAKKLPQECTAASKDYAIKRTGVGRHAFCWEQCPC